MSRGELSGGGPRAIALPKLFVAYRFDTKESKQFRQRLEVDIKNSDSLANVKVTDGHVETGESWPSEIRRRIKAARLVVADVTTLSPEVLFECGFAWGLNKTIMPVVEDSESASQLPSWLTELQITDFSTSKGRLQILDSVAKNISRTRFGRQRKPPPQPIPGKLIWLCGDTEFENYRDHAQQTATRHKLGMVTEERPHSIDEAKESLINEVSQASLMVACLNNSSSDPFIHFVTGVIVSKPTAGAAKRKLGRRVILAVPESISVDDVISDSARRCGNTVKVVACRQLNAELMSYGKMYKRYKKKVSDKQI